MNLNLRTESDRQADGTRKLVLARETLRTLTRDELRQAAGGARSNSEGISCARNAAC